MSASSLDNRVYWAKRESLESAISSTEASVSRDLRGEVTAKWQGELAILRERLTALGEPPAPRFDDYREERRDRLIAAALTGLLSEGGYRRPLADNAEVVAKEALLAADAVLAALDKERG